MNSTKLRGRLPLLVAGVLVGVAVLLYGQVELQAQAAGSPPWLAAWLEELMAAKLNAAVWAADANKAIALAVTIGVLGVFAGLLPATGLSRTKMIGGLLAALIAVGTLVRQSVYNVDPQLLKQYAEDINADADALRHTIVSEWPMMHGSDETQIARWRVATTETMMAFRRAYTDMRKAATRARPVSTQTSILDSGFGFFATVSAQGAKSGRDDDIYTYFTASGDGALVIDARENAWSAAVDKAISKVADKADICPSQPVLASYVAKVAEPVGYVAGKSRTKSRVSYTATIRVPNEVMDGRFVHALLASEAAARITVPQNGRVIVVRPGFASGLGVYVGEIRAASSSEPSRLVLFQPGAAPAKRSAPVSKVSYQDVLRSLPKGAILFDGDVRLCDSIPVQLDGRSYRLEVAGVQGLGLDQRLSFALFADGSSAK